MKQITETITTTITKYEADDGTIHASVNSCKYHEWKAQTSYVYVVYCRGQRTESTEIYSSKELAERAIGSSASHSIQKVYLDERFWKEQWESQNQKG